MSSPKSDAAAIRVVTWNVARGSERDAFWKRNGWAARKGPMQRVLTRAEPCILSVQEAMAEQLLDIGAALPQHG